MTGTVFCNVVLFSVLMYELLGPALTKGSQTLAGERRSEGKTSACAANKPKLPVSFH